MTNALLLLPDFMLIVIGCVLCRLTLLNRSVWDGAEKLVYFLLFPVLLFGSIVRSPLQIGTAVAMLSAGVVVMLIGIALSLGIGRLPGVDARLHASGAQTAFRFNSYIGLALSERLGGSSGVALMALLIAVCVPLSNIAAVWPLARHGGHRFGRELLRNPLIVATVAGLVANMCGLTFPEAVATTLQRIGNAALPLGLMAVGAGLIVGGLRDSPRLAVGFLTIRHAVLPLAALALCSLLDLPPTERAMVVAFAALPTASSCYVLAARMGGNGPFVAGLVSLSTLLGMASVPIWLAVLHNTAG
ncbi:MAG: transporter [Marmoricola sp.]|nr:transporter [Marmoricola sp.]